jgi:MFS family permease
MSRGAKVLAVTVIGASMTAIDTTIVNVARDTPAREFHSSASTVSWVLSAHRIVFAAVLLTSGRLADRHGRRRIYTTGLLIFISASALCGAAPKLLLFAVPFYAPAALMIAGGVFGLAYFVPDHPGYWTHFAPFLVMIGAASGTLIVGLQIGVGSMRAVERARDGFGVQHNASIAIAVAALTRPGHQLANFDFSWFLQGCAGICVAVPMRIGYRPSASCSPQTNAIVAEQATCRHSRFHDLRHECLVCGPVGRRSRRRLDAEPHHL